MAQGIRSRFWIFSTLGHLDTVNSDVFIKEGSKSNKFANKHTVTAQTACFP